MNPRRYSYAEFPPVSIRLLAIERQRRDFAPGCRSVPTYSYPWLASVRAAMGKWRAGARDLWMSERNCGQSAHSMGDHLPQLYSRLRILHFCRHLHTQTESDGESEREERESDRARERVREGERERRVGRIRSILSRD